MTEAKIKEYLNSQGVPYTEPIYQDGQKLRVLDLTQLPALLREQFDARGFFIASKHEDTSKGKKK